MDIHKQQNDKAGCYIHVRQKWRENILQSGVVASQHRVVCDIETMGAMHPNTSKTGGGAHTVNQVSSVTPCVLPSLVKYNRFTAQYTPPAHNSILLSYCPAPISPFPPLTQKGNQGELK